MWRFLKKLFGLEFSKTLKKTIIDSKLGKLVCEYESTDEFYTWNTEFQQQDKTDKVISISIDGDLNGPFFNVLQKTYQILESLSDLSNKVQTEIDLKFSDKKINIYEDFNLEDISVYKDEESNSLNYDLEYYSGDCEIMISVEFINDKIDIIEFY